MVCQNNSELEDLEQRMVPNCTQDCSFGLVYSSQLEMQGGSTKEFTLESHFD